MSATTNIREDASKGLRWAPNFGEYWDPDLRADTPIDVQFGFLELIVEVILDQFGWSRDSESFTELVERVVPEMMEMDYLGQENFSMISEEFNDAVRTVRQLNESTEDGA